jgi:hypothetical protein
MAMPADRKDWVFAAIARAGAAVREHCPDGAKRADALAHLADAQRLAGEALAEEGPAANQWGAGTRDNPRA